MTIDEVSQVLENLGYKVKPAGNAVYVAVGNPSKPFAAVLTIDDNRRLTITCQVAKLGDFSEDDLPTTLFGLLDLNTSISPYAFGILSANDDPQAFTKVEEYPIVLTDSLPLGDLSTQELAKSMDSLLVALKAGVPSLKTGLKER